jgi:membrane-associated protease RseP (regulator of RpoE activity)
MLRLSASLLALAIVAAGPLAAANATYPPATGGEQNRPMLGVQMTPVPLSVQEQEGLTPNQGVLVQSIFNNTAAQTMGLMAGDVILTVNGAQITSMTDLRNEVALNQVGDPVEVTVDRQGQQVTSTGQFQTWPSNIPYEPIDPGMEQNFRNWQERRLDQSRQDLDDLQKQVDGMRNQLAGGAGSDAAGTGKGDGGTGVYDGPAWHFAYGIAAKTAPGTWVVAAGPQHDEAAELGVTVPLNWRFAWGVSSAASAPASQRGTP